MAVLNRKTASKGAVFLSRLESPATRPVPARMTRRRQQYKTPAFHRQAEYRRFINRHHYRARNRMRMRRKRVCSQVARSEHPLIVIVPRSYYRPARSQLVFLERIQDGLDETAQKLRQLDRVKFHASSLLKRAHRMIDASIRTLGGRNLDSSRNHRSCNHPMHKRVVLFQRSGPSWPQASGCRASKSPS